MKIKIWIALLLVYIVWGATYLGIRFAVETIPPFLMAGTRFLLAGAVLVLWRHFAGDPAPSRKQCFNAVVVGLLLLFGGNGLLSLAETNVSSGLAALLIASAPLWMTTIEAVLPGGTRPNWLGILGLVIGFGGIILLVAPSLFGTGRAGSHPWGIMTLLAGALFWSLGSIYSRHAELPPSSLLSTGVEMLAGGVGLYLAGTLTGEWHQLVLARVTERSWLGLIYLILFGSMVGFTAYAWLLRNAPVALVATYAYVNPLVAILLGSLFARELLTGRILLAASVIVGSVVLINISRRIQGRAVSAVNLE